MAVLWHMEMGTHRHSPNISWGHIGMETHWEGDTMGCRHIDVLPLSQPELFTPTLKKTAYLVLYLLFCFRINQCLNQMSTATVPVRDNAMRRKWQRHYKIHIVLNNGPTHGFDDLTTEFYKLSWLTIMLADSYIYSFQKGYVSPTQQKGISTLMNTGKKPSRENLITHWRPIIPFTADYRIIGMKTRHIIN